MWNGNVRLGCAFWCMFVTSESRAYISSAKMERPGLLYTSLGEQENNRRNRLTAKDARPQKLVQCGEDGRISSSIDTLVMCVFTFQASRVS